MLRTLFPLLFFAVATAPAASPKAPAPSCVDRLRDAEPALGVHAPDDWLRVRLEHLKPLGLKSLVLDHFAGSPYAAARALYPDHAFPFWKLPRLPKFVFHDRDNQRRFVHWLAAEHRIERPEDWYRLSQTDFQNANGLQLLRAYGYSKAALLEAVYPGEKFYDWLFAGKLGNGYWDLPEHRREYMTWLAGKLGIENDDDWYRVSAADFKANAGGGILAYFGNDRAKAIQDHLWNRPLQGWRFTSGTPWGLFDDDVNVGAFGRWLLEQPGFETPEKILEITAKQLQAFGANALLGRHGRSPYRAAVAVLRAMESDVEHHPWLANRVPHGFWASPENRAEFWRWLGRRMHWERPEDWYALSHEVLEAVVSGNVATYVPTLAAMAREANPGFAYREWLFHKVPPNFWAEAANRRAFTEWLADRLELAEREDWYRLSIDLVDSHGGSGLLDRYDRSVARMLADVRPELALDPERFVYYSKGEETLAIRLRTLFPDDELLRRYRPSHLRFASGRKIEMDVYLPARKLCFEYQGEQHYEARDFFGGAAGLAETQRRDAEKRAILEKAGIRLIEVRYDWDQTLESLAALINLKVN